MSQDEREQFFAWIFQSLGHIVHLIQDASVPAHTRNDLHMDKWLERLKYFPGFLWLQLFLRANREPFEDWTAENLDSSKLILN